MLPEYDEYLAYIADPGVRAAFQHLLSTAEASGRFDLRKAAHGYMRNITFFAGERKPYSVVPAKQWFTFYVRTPAVTHPGLTLEALRNVFPEAERAHSPEFKVKIRSTDEANSALAFIGIAAPMEFRLPDEVPGEPGELREGLFRRVTVNAYERNREARDRCIRHYGCRCVVCDFSFEDVYGDIGRAYIHVHHLVPIASIGEQYTVDPVRDLRPVCANCHAMLHSSEPPLSIEALEKRLYRR